MELTEQDTLYVGKNDIDGRRKFLNSALPIL